MAGSPPEITIIIRAKNEQERLGDCLRMIEAQDTAVGYQVLLIDSGSKDDTLKIARAFPNVVIRQIPPATFNYGGTLNDGVVAASTPYVIALSAHCVPVNRHWLKHLLEPLSRDMEVAGSFSRQIPWPDCEPVEREFLENEFKAEDYTAIGVTSIPTELDTMYSNASSCFRRDIALRIPFRKISYCEDRVWAHAVLQAGHKIAYASRSVVRHSHQRSILGFYRLGRLTGEAVAQVGLPRVRLRDFEWYGPQAFRRTLRKWKKICKKQGTVSSRLPLAILQSLGRVLAQDIGVWRGQAGVTKGIKG
jgi:rhamnosyltransferase